jgi:hypothetical protein
VTSKADNFKRNLIFTKRTKNIIKLATAKKWQRATCFSTPLCVYEQVLKFFFPFALNSLMVYSFYERIGGRRAFCQLTTQPSNKFNFDVFISSSFRFDVLVNGGGAITLQFQRSPFSPQTKTVFVPWNQIVALPPVQMQLNDNDEPSHRNFK